MTVTRVDFGYESLDFVDVGQDGWIGTLRHRADPADPVPWDFEKASLHLWWLLTRQCRTAVDVGSFNGLYAMLAAKGSACQKVLAFEPMPTSYGTTVLNLRLNGLDGRVMAVNCALGSTREHGQVHSSAGPYVMTSGESLLRPDLDYSYAIWVDTLDGLLASPDSVQGWTGAALAGTVDVLKIDVEGFETEALRGMTGTCFGGGNRPDFIVELLAEDALASFAAGLPEAYCLVSIAERTGDVQVLPDGERLAWAGPTNYWATCRAADERARFADRLRAVVPASDWTLTEIA